MFSLCIWMSIFVSVTPMFQVTEVKKFWPKSESFWMLTPAINSLCPSDTIWWQRSGSTLAQVMAWCLTAPSHYLNQYINVDWSSAKSSDIHIRAISQEMPQPSICLKITCLKFHSNFPGANELNPLDFICLCPAITVCCETHWMHIIHPFVCKRQGLIENKFSFLRNSSFKFNPLALGRFERNIMYVNFKLT